MTPHKSITYHIKQSTFSIVYGDITKMNVDIIASSDDQQLSMGGGVSYAILQAAGYELYSNTREIPRLYVGDVYVTTAGQLPAKYIFHIITIDHQTLTFIDVESIKKSVSTALKLCVDNGCTSIAFPAIATGVARIPFEDAAIAMTDTIAQFLTNTTASLNVSITLFARSGIPLSQLDRFYDKAIASSVQLYVAQSLEVQLSSIVHNNPLSLVSTVQNDIHHIIQSNLQSTTNHFYTHTPMHTIQHINSVVETEVHQHHDHNNDPQLIHTQILAIQLMLNQLYVESQQSMFNDELTISAKIRDYEKQLMQLKKQLE
ncbi:MAG: hypothetical protein RI985_332 [Chloroflexota bacterium]|jgi:O-acetyl-ADP-ribose deacetylase (regulator of RNase III)